ncbi:MAG: hypothetical protein RAP70_05240 [Candidatus Celaenobacter antarcticus]|nr:hypothetical protein [Candidatus Celaenobacter antarcticus]
MGTQQILLIVLSVIIVGIAVAVGITMFNAQSVNSNRNACIADMNNFSSSALAFYKTPVSHGGAGSDSLNVTIDKVGNYIGVGYVENDDQLNTGNGVYTITLESPNIVKFTAAGTETGVTPVTTVSLSTSAIATTP